MKKIKLLSLALALCVALGAFAPAMAEMASATIGGTTTETATGTEPTFGVAAGTEYETAFGVKLQLPEGWTPMDESLYETIMSVGAEAVGLDDATMAQMQSTLDNNYMFMLYAPDFKTNFNITVQDMVGNTTEIPASLLISLVYPGLKGQLEGTFQDAVLSEPSAVKVGDVEYMFFTVNYTMMNMPIYLEMYMYCPGEKLYMLTTTFSGGENDETFRQQVNDMITTIQY